MRRRITNVRQRRAHLCNALALCLLLAGSLLMLAHTRTVQARRTHAPQTSAASRQHLRYQINFKLDFDNRSFNGTERVRWVNRDTRPASTLYFHLYANLRSNDAPRSTPTAANDDAQAADEPRPGITTVRVVTAQNTLAYARDDQATILRVNLREPVPAGGTTEIEIAFTGHVPEIDPDETSLPAHVVQQLGAALRDTRETRRARDLNFRARGIMLLGTAYPVLAVRDGNDWQREVKASVGDLVFAEVADYDVTIAAPPAVTLFTSGDVHAPVSTDTSSATRAFGGENLRNFAILAGRTLKTDEREVEGVRVRSIWAAEHEKMGRHALEVAATAVRLFNARFGQLPYRNVSIGEAPLVAGLGSVEFAGLSFIASAFYVDFDSPVMRNLPDIVREQRTSVEDSFEFAVAHMCAHQWWGMSVGSAPERTPVQDEALAHWSALVYYREAHSPERAAQARDDQLRGVYEIYRTFG